MRKRISGNSGRTRHKRITAFVLFSAPVGANARQFVRPGDRFGRLTVIDPEVRWVVPSVPRGLRAAFCRCDCGQEVTAPITQLAQGKRTSCGCLRRDKNAAKLRSHGLSGHPLYAIHKAMMQRCYRPDHHAYARYGGRGIRVCERWHDVRLFIDDIEREIGPRPKGLTLDRTNNDGNYEPGNVRWATRSEQSSNQRRRRGKVA